MHSGGDDRSFKNPFPPYTSDIAASSLTAPDGRRLNGAWEQNIRQCIHRLMNQLESGLKHDVDFSDTSVYTGISGIALLFFRIYEKLDRQQNDEFLTRAYDLIKHALKALKGKRCSFLCGDAGPLACGAVFANYLCHKDTSEKYLTALISMAEDVEDDPEIPDELLYGRAGYLYSLMFVRKHLGDGAIPNEVFDRVVDAIVASGENLAKRVQSPAPLMYIWHKSYYLGAAHGLSGIFFILMKSPGFVQNAPLKQLVQRSIDYLINLRFSSGNYPSSLNNRENDKLVHWCHGASGFIHMFIQAYRVYGDDKYLNEARSCAEVLWKRGLLHKGYGICHGAAGNGYGFLMLYHITQEPKYLYQALKFAEWMFDYGSHGCRVADRPYSLFEGMAGTLHYLVDLLHPMEAEFPAFY